MSDPADDIFDVGGVEGAAAPSDRLALLQAAAKQVIELEAIAEQMEEELKATKAQITELKSKGMVDLMTELRMPEFTHEGIKFKVKDFVNGSLPKLDENPEGRKKALEWLDANGGEALFKTEVSVAFGRNQHNAALAVADKIRSELAEMGIEVPVETTSGVHPSTLCAWAREKMNAKEDFPAETLGLFVGRAVTSELAEKPKRGRKAE